MSKDNNDSDFSLNNSNELYEEIDDILENDNNINKSPSIDINNKDDKKNNILEFTKKQNDIILNNINNMNNNILNMTREIHNTSINLNNLVNLIT
jgi:spore cortex formation protein SpoVR/YcgB (stage V sporulation)